MPQTRDSGPHWTHKELTEQHVDIGKQPSQDSETPWGSGCNTLTCSTNKGPEAKAPLRMEFMMQLKMTTMIYFYKLVNASCVQTQAKLYGMHPNWNNVGFWFKLLFKMLPATIPKHTVPLLKELANHGCRFAAGQIVGISTVVPFFA